MFGALLTWGAPLLFAVFWYRAADEYQRIQNWWLGLASYVAFLLMWFVWPGSWWLAVFAQVAAIAAVTLVGALRMSRQD